MTFAATLPIVILLSWQVSAPETSAPPLVAPDVPGAPPGPHFRQLEIGIVLYVEDVRNSVSFYRDKLGFTLDHYIIYRDGAGAVEVTDLAPQGPEPYGATLRAGNQSLGLQLNSSEVRLPASGARYHFEVDDSATYYERLVNEGLTVHHLIRMSGTGRPFMFSVNDPDGHWLFFRGPIRADGDLPPNPSLQRTPPG